MLIVGTFDVFDAKVLNYEHGCHRVGSMPPQVICETDWTLSVYVEVIYEALVVEKAGLGKPIHALSNIDKHFSISGDVSEVVQAGLPITGNWTTTQKTRQICHRIIEFFGVILLIFREESESE